MLRLTDDRTWERIILRCRFAKIDKEMWDGSIRTHRTVVEVFDWLNSRFVPSIFVNLCEKVPCHCAILDDLGSSRPRNQHWLILFVALVHMNGPCSWNLPLNVSLSLGTLVIYAHPEDKLSGKLSLLSFCAQKNSQSSTADERSIQCWEQRVFLRTLLPVCCVSNRILTR